MLSAWPEVAQLGNTALPTKMQATFEVQERSAEIRFLVERYPQELI